MDVKRPLSSRLEIISILALLSLIILVRVHGLNADPPTGLSISTDVFTDPSQYTLFAKMYVKLGDFNPFHDFRLTVFLKSSVTLLAVIIFKLLGVGLWQSNFVGLLYSFGSLFLFFLFIRKAAGELAGLLYLILICFNYNQLFYGRLPFLEHAMAFYAFLSLVLVSYSRRWIRYLLAGLSLGIAVFFGKMIGVVFLFPFACFLVYRFVYEKKTAKPLIFIGGLGIVTVFWYFFTYVPMKEQVTGYFQEQAFSLYGVPEGLKSFGDFVWKLVSFGDDSKLFSRMPVIGLLGAVFVGMILYRVARPRSWKEGFGTFKAGHVFVTAMIIAFYCSLMIWNYRPLRYQLVLIYPFYGAAASVLAILWQRGSAPKLERVPYLFYLFCLPLVMVPLYQMYSALMDRLGYEFYYEDNKYLLAGVSAIVSILVCLCVTLYKKGEYLRLRRVGQSAVIIIVIALPVFGFLDYHYWWQRSTFTASDNSRDLGMILSPGAVLSGPYAPALTLENSFNTIIHMFGVSQADPDLLKKFPITHLLLDRANETRARRDYPEVMDSAVHMLTYHVGLKKVRLFRIAGHTGNPEADGYLISHFEKAVDLYDEGSVSEANELALKFLKTFPANISCYLLLGEQFEARGFYEAAEPMFKKAVEFSPTNYDLNARLAKYYKDHFEVSGNQRFKEEGLKYFERAIKYAPTVGKIKRTYKELRENDPWQLNNDTILSRPVEAGSSSLP